MPNRYLRMEEGYDIFYQVGKQSAPICLKGKTLSYNPLCLNGKSMHTNLPVECLVKVSINIELDS